MPEYRIKFTIEEVSEDDAVTEIGFGSSSNWSTIKDAAYEMESIIDNRIWETGPGMPDPEEVGRGD